MTSASTNVVSAPPSAVSVFLQAAIRWVLLAAGGYAVSKGWVSASAETGAVAYFMGFGAIMAAAIWEMLAHSQNGQKIQALLDLVANMSTAQQSAGPQQGTGQ